MTDVPRRHTWQDYLSINVDGIESSRLNEEGGNSHTVRYFFDLLPDDMRDLGIRKSYTGLTYDDGKICEFCWLRHGSVHGDKSPEKCFLTYEKRQHETLKR